MELRHLRYFIAVASHGSFNRAAESLHLTQPPLSRQVKDLEEELGVTLLVRGSNSVRLTEAGDLFYEEAREVLARADDAMARMRGGTGKEFLRVGYTPSMTAGIIASVLGKFQTVAPRVRIELADPSSREINERAGKGLLDLLISPSVAVSKIPGFQWIELCRMRPVLVLPARHPLAKLVRIPLARVRRLPLVGLGKKNYPEYAPAVRELLKPHGIAASFVSMVDESFATLFVELEAKNAAFISLEGVVGILPNTLVAKLFSPNLDSVPVVIGLPALRPSPHAKLFAQLLIEETQR
ncbi:MAG: LysR family transcriptional regulator [Terrimicrobiaceae bacterium]|nr:LysR family transcriptional regulator [Terrimicrobiaceae bacterium]